MTIKTIVLLLLISIPTYGQSINEDFFKEVDIFLKKHVQYNSVNYTALQATGDIMPLISKIEKANITNLDKATKKAFYIIAYNLHVIDQVLKEYPITSVQDIPVFFDKKKITVAGQKISLNGLEKDYLLRKYDDPRLHFVLVCGAVGCPPITDFAYTPLHLDQQLEKQTRLALNDSSFIKTSENKTEISEIFKWYSSDFGGNKTSVKEYINEYRNTDISNKVSYYPYDWTLNDTRIYAQNAFSENGLASSRNNASRYIVSSTIPLGTYEAKIFNNLYTQKTGSNGILSDRSSFFTTTITALYGLQNRLNIGINTRIRRVRNNKLPSSAFGVFGSDNQGTARSGLTAIGPMIRWAPVPKWQNFSIQSSYTFALGDDLTNSEGGSGSYIDWDGAVWNTQFFNDSPIGTNFSLFTELDFLWEDIGGSNNDVKRTPLTAILSYYPNKKSAIYALSGYSPTWSLENEKGESILNISDYFYQLGLGAKYQFTPNFEIEILYTDFSNKGLSENDGQAATYNLGLRINL